jgi:CHASE3 domain sensor protein
MSARTKFTRKVVVGFLFAVFLLSTAKAQVPQQFFGMFNSLRQLQQQQQFQQPLR